MRFLSYACLATGISGCLFFDHDGAGTGGSDAATSTGGSTVSAGGSGGAGASTSTMGGGATTASGGSGGTGGQELPCEPYDGIEGLCLLARVPPGGDDNHFLAGTMAVSANHVYFVARHPTLRTHDIANTDVPCDVVEIYRVPFDHPPDSPPPPPIRRYSSAANEEFPAMATSPRHVNIGVSADESKVLIGFQGDPAYRNLLGGMPVPVTPHANAFALGLAQRVYVAVPGTPTLVAFDETETLELPPAYSNQAWLANWVDFKGTASMRKLAIGVYSRLGESGGAVCATDPPLTMGGPLPNADCTPLDAVMLAYTASQESIYARGQAVLDPPKKAKIHQFKRSSWPQSSTRLVDGDGPIHHLKNRLWVVESNGSVTWPIRDRLSCLNDELEPCGATLGFTTDFMRRIAAIASPPGLDNVMYLLVDIQSSGNEPSRLGLFRYRP